MLVVAVLLALAGCGGRGAPLPEVERPLELLGRPTVSGGALDPARIENKVVVVNFWSPG